MTSLDDFKQQLLEAEKAASIPQDKYHEMARTLVNIERQSFYGDESERNRLKKIREAIDAAVKRGGE
jgi:uridine kinase